LEQRVVASSLKMDIVGIWHPEKKKQQREEKMNLERGLPWKRQESYLDLQ